MVKPRGQNSLFVQQLISCIFDALDNFFWLAVRVGGAKFLEVLKPQEVAFIHKDFQVFLQSFIF